MTYRYLIGSSPIFRNRYQIGKPKVTSGKPSILVELNYATYTEVDLLELTVKDNIIINLRILPRGNT